MNRCEVESTFSSEFLSNLIILVLLIMMGTKLQTWLLSIGKRTIKRRRKENSEIDKKCGLSLEFQIKVRICKNFKLIFLMVGPLH